MCGIAGIVRLTGGVDSDEDRTRLARMRDRLRHRGPDGDGMFVCTEAGLAHTRLALVDPEGGAQPITSADGRYTLVYNGEVYNAAELRAELADRWAFRSRCDAEVVLAAFVRWGSACVHRLNGMFAFFVWDSVEQVGTAARDLLGVKPFVYGYSYQARQHELVFASEAKAVLAALPGRPRANHLALLEYLVAPCFSGVEAPLFERLAYLPPGHILTVARHGVRVTEWGRHDLHAPTDDVTAGELDAALARAVERTLIADAPVGQFLSGGLDSTAIAAHACVPAFTIRFADQDRFDYARSRIVIDDDTPFAELAARDLGLPHTFVDVDRSTLAADLRGLATTNDALPAWEQELAQHHLSRAAAHSCKAVLVGDAADETHYGYHFLLDPLATASPRGILARFGCHVLHRDVLPDPVAHFDAHYRRLAERALLRWDTPADQLRATSHLVLTRWLPRLLHNGDIHAMAHSLEARVPFADVELLALARRVGPKTALASGVEKALLREAVRGRIPEEIRTRKKSALPKDQGAARVYQREAQRTLDEHAADFESLLDMPHVRTLCDPARVLDERERALLFRLICLGHWLDAYGVRL
jgi:asparagine synthase (glutamine-hydrolysing)